MMVTLKTQILEKLAEVEKMLENATCEGVQLAELPYYNEVGELLEDVINAVDYYVD